ncbi:MAG: hypothetical protein OEV74_20400 [Cyclobacteriaceae bacterium]|nr:hypothetical protein [Cyclobacteriaceae bacterium]MDH4298646.1 hypothetical protein [Cyclobacteriaceae bacterium]
MRKIFDIIVLFLIGAFPLFAQEQVEQKGDDEGSYPHRLSIMMANSHIPAADDVNGKKTVFIVPTWGIDYDYWFGEKWAIGLHNDIVLQQYKIEEREGKDVIERSFPVGVCIVGLFKPWRKITLIAGVGKELERSESFNMVNFGVEYGIELPKHWELSVNLLYDSKLKVYDSWIFGVGFSRFLKK